MKRALGVLLFLCGAPILLAQTADDEREAIKALSASNSGATGQNSPEGNTATNRDFVSMLIMAVEAAQDGKPVTLDWNIHPGQKTGKKPSTLQIEAVLAQPDLASNITAALTNAGMADRLKRSLSYSDDVTATITWTNSDKVKKHLEALKDTTPMAEESLRSNQATRRQLASDVGVAETDADPEIVRALATRAAVRAAEADTQFYISGSYRHRSSLAGPNEWKAKVTYEMPMGRSATSAKTLAKQDAKKTASSANTRMAFSAELSEVKAHHFEIADDNGVPISVDPTKSTHSYVGRASIGSDVYKPPDPNHTGRLEFSLSYDDVTGDESKNNRFVSVLTYTQKLNEKTSLPIALIYANKTQFVGDVNKRFSMHFGISFKLSDM
jgi:hypothetical protein